MVTVRRLAAGFALTGLVAAGAVACTSDEPVPLGAHRLVFFDSCDDALAELRAATRAAVGPYGLTPWAADGGEFPPSVGGEMPIEDRADAMGELAKQPAPVPAPAGQSAGRAGGAEAESGHSGTNVHEAGVDEPDLVKTDGRRIVTVSQGRLSVVDVQRRRLVGVVDLLPEEVGYDAQLLIAGDRALVITNAPTYRIVVDDLPMPAPEAVPAPDAALAPDAVLAEPVPDLPSNPPVDSMPVFGARLVLVDLTTPRILSRARMDGSIVDARQVGDVVRVVTRSQPRLSFPVTPVTPGGEAERLAANQAVVDASGIDAWAPRLEVTTGGKTVRTQVACESISRPTNFSGTSLLTVLTFDLGQDGLGDGRPITIAADGTTVYSNGRSLYVASDQNWSARLVGFAPRRPAQAGTEIYQFDTTTTVPRFVGGGRVPGYLINQYAMSEWDGRLRVATTTDGSDGGPSQSGVYVLAAKDGQLTQVGAVEGLGLGERIYAVRFLGPVGYVVTFRQTDPLYTVDLRDPTAPVVRGELKIPGYSAYLHPVDETRLIGVGQDATETGQTLGAQVSLFDVADLDNPSRVTTFTLRGSYSEAEFDPHAFLYWPTSGLLVVPLQLRGRGAGPLVDPARGFAPEPTSGALVLRVTGDQIVEVGLITHPAAEDWYSEPIRRSLITTAGGTTLWTVSSGGLLASDPDTLARLAWIPL